MRHGAYGVRDEEEAFGTELRAQGTGLKKDKR